jgi:hypothetical protein
MRKPSYVLLCDVREEPLIGLPGAGERRPREKGFKN